MDTQTQTGQSVNQAGQRLSDAAALRIGNGQRLIKEHMPQTYSIIKEYAEIQGQEVWTNVRRGLAGEPGFFWAVENGVTIGAAFTGQPAWQAVALAVETGGACVCIMSPAGSDKERAYGKA